MSDDDHRYVPEKHGFAGEKDLVEHLAELAEIVAGRVEKEPGAVAAAVEPGDEFGKVPGAAVDPVDKDFQRHRPAADHFRLVVVTVAIAVADHQQLILAGRQVQAVEGTFPGKMADIDDLALPVQVGDGDDGGRVFIQAGAVLDLAEDKEIIGMKHVLVYPLGRRLLVEC